MIPDLNGILNWLSHYKYLVIFPFAVFEGPIITILAGFLASLGKLNFWIAYSVVVAGDIFSDTMYFYIGRFGRERFILKYGKYLGLNIRRVEIIERNFKTHPWKIFSFGKVAHGTGSLILTAAGLSRVPYLKFLGYNIPTTLANSFILIILGFYFGHAYASFNTYFDFVALFCILLLIVLYVYFIWRTKNSLDS
jgi:membrane protein DedA with SNARE-associated domain